LKKASLQRTNVKQKAPSHLNLEHFAGGHAVGHLHLNLVARRGGEGCAGRGRDLQEGVQVAPHPRLHGRTRHRGAQPLLQLAAALLLGRVAEAKERPQRLLAWKRPVKKKRKETVSSSFQL
jgi:hypothetical protein